MLTCSCGKGSEKTAYPKPYWSTNPSLPDNPSRFCEKVRAIFVSLPAASNFRCQEQLRGSLGARVDVANSQVVLLQGARAEWFMFAYEFGEEGREIDKKLLDQVQLAIEKAL